MPRSRSITTADISLLRMLSTSAGLVSRKRPRQKGCESQPPRKACTYMPSVTARGAILISIALPPARRRGGHDGQQGRSGRNPQDSQTRAEHSVPGKRKLTPPEYYRVLIADRASRGVAKTALRAKS